MSLIATLLFLIVAVAFAPSKLSLKKRIMIGILHVFAHLAVSLLLMLALEVSIEWFVKSNLVETSGQFSLPVMCDIPGMFSLSVFHSHTS